MPPKSDGDSAKGMFLQMSDKDGGGIPQSPSFTFAAADPAAIKPAAEQNIGQAETAAGVNPHQWSDQPTAAVPAEYPGSVPTPTDGRSSVTIEISG